MPKHEALTPKAISNRIKSIGLQKLRWYCQMCQKQCRDENGFKCHTTSESHLRQMRLFAENPDQQIDEFSAEFERGFVEMLSYRHGTKRVLANRVYQEYIGDKHHIHMNATIWTSLTEICKYLGKEGKVTADETEKGWFIQYIDRDPRLLAKQAAMDQRKVVEYDQEERTKRAIELQIAACAESERRKRIENGDEENDQSAAVNEDLTREEGNKIEIAFGTKSGSGLISKGIKRPLKLISFGFDKSSEVESGSSKSRRDDDEPQSKRYIPPSSTSTSTSTSTSSTFSSFPASTSSNSSTSTSTSTVPSIRTVPMSAMEQIRMEEEKKKILSKQKQKEASAENTEYWLQPGIVVKILNKKVGNGKFYQRKAVVLEVVDKYVGELNVLECNTILRIDQEHLETVIPKIGNTVKILNGYGKGRTANLTKINEEDFSCDIVYENERKEKKEIFGVIYENISKLYSGE